MFTRIIDPFNNQTWKVPNKPEPTLLYKTKGENVQQKKMKKTLSHINKSLNPENIKACDTWTVAEEGISQSAQEGKEEECEYEIDDFVIV